MPSVPAQRLSLLHSSATPDRSSPLSTTDNHITGIPLPNRHASVILFGLCCHDGGPPVRHSSSTGRSSWSARGMRSRNVFVRFVYARKRIPFLHRCLRYRGLDQLDRRLPCSTYWKCRLPYGRRHAILHLVMHTPCSERGKCLCLCWLSCDCDAQKLTSPLIYQTPDLEFVEVQQATLQWDGE